ncbi:MAG: AbrB/MazE/SpoVT family DNA-binding domain-containing protein [Nitrospirota bacterium]|nr:AbrB/MazE/SpoVT family DNA-binding domain-containing protein [Nitrospirota bacterium]MDH5775424.1 AbrB/MazE/SpoVT family DNA-binding domain-containing protein [Nitrospirota bacterium]
MKSSVTKIGNSKGVIIPSHLLKQCGFTKEVSLEIKNDTLVISKAKKPREGWAEAFMEAGAGDEELLINDVNNDFDQDEWVW